MRNSRQLTILLPCRNEEQSIATVLEDAHAALAKAGIENEILVADNGSTDATARIAEKCGARVIKVETIGYGNALHQGILAAKFPYVLLADADGSYNFDRLKDFAASIGTHDLVLGSRFSGKIAEGAMPSLHRYVGTPAFSYLIRKFYGIGTTDAFSGMRMLSKSFYEALKMRSGGMEWTVELLVKGALSRCRYAEVPIEYNKDKRNRKSHLRTVRDGLRSLSVLLRHLSKSPVALIKPGAVALE